MTLPRHVRIIANNGQEDRVRCFLFAIRLDPKVLGWLRRTAEKKGLPYQSLVNEILAEEMRKAS